METITHSLQDDEIFVVLNSEDSFCTHVDEVRAIGSLATVNELDEYMPSRVHVVAKAIFAMKPNEVIDTGKYGTIGSAGDPELKITKQTELELYLTMESLAHLLD